VEIGNEIPNLTLHLTLFSFFSSVIFEKYYLATLIFKDGLKSEKRKRTNSGIYECRVMVSWIPRFSFGWNLPIYIHIPFIPFLKKSIYIRSACQYQLLQEEKKSFPAQTHNSALIKTSLSSVRKIKRKSLNVHTFLKISIFLYHIKLSLLCCVGHFFQFTRKYKK
jgi:hypothetical protein